MKVVLQCSEYMPDQDIHGYIYTVGVHSAASLQRHTIASPSASCVDYCMWVSGRGDVYIYDSDNDGLMTVDTLTSVCSSVPLVVTIT